MADQITHPLLEVEYRDRQSNVMLTTQGQSTLKVFGWSGPSPARHTDNLNNTVYVCRRINRLYYWLID